MFYWSIVTKPLFCYVSDKLCFKYNISDCICGYLYYIAGAVSNNKTDIRATCIIHDGSCNAARYIIIAASVPIGHADDY